MARMTVSSSGLHASLTWSDGRGRRGTRGTVATTPTSATRVAGGWAVCAAGRNRRSRAALDRIGGKSDGILRAHRMAADYIARDSVRYSIVAVEWPAVKQQLSQFLSQEPPAFAAN